jgi:Uma2 family endonuclease
LDVVGLLRTGSEGNRGKPIRVTYDKGSIEIMSPLPEHECFLEAIGAMLDVMTVERGISMARFGSTTFRRRDLECGLEPDKCYYLRNAGRVRGMRDFDPTIYPPPDLAIELDIIHRLVEREPIYAALGVPELWRFDGQHLTVLMLNEKHVYDRSETSSAFPFLPMKKFETFLLRMKREDQNTILREFRQWSAGLPDS